ncbi:MAG: thioesterase family protein [Chloroflexi bacterium]|nr:thioesterase family protein [Chloroflexota bacterium]
MPEAFVVNELIAISNHLFVATSPFTKGLGLAVESMGAETASMKFTWRGDLTGSERTPNLHGGVIASVFDITGSLAVFSNLVFRMKGKSVRQRVERIKRINTIDLRIDYLRPGAGESFLVIGRIMRTGKTVAVTRMELHNEHDALLAVGTGSYILSVVAEATGSQSIEV